MVPIWHLPTPDWCHHDTFHYPVGANLAPPPYAQDYYSKAQGSTDITWHFRQTPMSRIENLQVKEITLKVEKAKPESFTLTKPDPDGEFTVTFKDEGFKSMGVTVVYKDGERRTAVYKAWDKIQEPFIERCWGDFGFNVDTWEAIVLGTKGLIYEYK